MTKVYTNDTIKRKLRNSFYNVLSIVTQRVVLDHHPHPSKVGDTALATCEAKQGNWWFESTPNLEHPDIRCNYINSMLPKAIRLNRWLV